MATTKRARPRRRKKKSKAELEQARQQRAQKREVRAILDAAGFQRFPTAADKEFTFRSVTSDFDDIFVNENVVLLVEYTIASKPSDHLKRKGPLYAAVTEHAAEFVEFLQSAPLDIADANLSSYDASQVELRVVYCSLQRLSQSNKSVQPSVIFFDREIVQYFKSLTKAIRRSSLYELLAFLQVDSTQYADRARGNSSSIDQYRGSVLPEAHSNYPDGYKVVSLYLDPASLLERAYVLRRGGWRTGGTFYQRLIMKSKIDALRKYLLKEKRVFVNNIVVTLPSTTKLTNDSGNTIDTKTITKTSPAHINLPNEFNSVGVIDGQHRLFSYHEGGVEDDSIALFRAQQNLLVTGIIYPEGTHTAERESFEAQLFLEINSNQTNARTDLKQAIQLVLAPFADGSIARAVLESLNDKGALEDVFQRSEFETKLLKTTTVVSYGIKPLVRVDGRLFDLWDDPDKGVMVAERDHDALVRYISFCSSTIRQFLAAARHQFPDDLWEVKSRQGPGLLSTTLINGLLGALRQDLETNIDISFEHYDKRLKGLQKFDFGQYKSSQYTVMSTELAEKFLS